MKVVLGILIVATVVIGAFFALDDKGRGGYAENVENTIPTKTMKLTSTHFSHLQSIPQKYSCDGENTNPELLIEEVPENTKSLVLVMDDPDATGGRTWDHWIVWNIDPGTRVIKENSVPAGAIQGTTSFGDREYGGPCPPKGNDSHRYMFKLYALDTILDIKSDSHKDAVEGAIDGHVIDETLLIGTFGR